MLCVYELDAVCRCPVDDKPDYYRVTITAHRTVPVEEILRAAKEQGEVKQYQEDFTDNLARALAVRVQTVGHHSGVRTTVTCGTE